MSASLLISLAARPAAARVMSTRGSRAGAMHRAPPASPARPTSSWRVRTFSASMDDDEDYDRALEGGSEDSGESLGGGARGELDELNWTRSRGGSGDEDSDRAWSEHLGPIKATDHPGKHVHVTAGRQNLAEFRARASSTPWIPGWTRRDTEHLHAAMRSKGAEKQPVSELGGAGNFDPLGLSAAPLTPVVRAAAGEEGHHPGEDVRTRGMAMALSPTVDQYMTQDVVTVRPEMPLAEVADTFLHKGVSGAPVVDEGGRLVGVISESDVLWIPILDTWLQWRDNKAYREDVDRILATRAEDAMCKDPLTVQPSEEISRAVEKMLERNVNRLPVTDGDKLVGIITRRDIVKCFSDHSHRISKPVAAFTAEQLTGGGKKQSGGE